VARDRKRAKQRRDRSRAAAVSRGGAQRSGEPAPATGADDTVESGGIGPEDALEPGGIVRADIPGALDHASSDVDEFDAALVRGAGGVPADNELAEQAFGEDVEEDAGDQDGSDDVLQTLGGGGGTGGGGARGGGGGHGGSETPSGAPIRGGNRAVGFIRASWAELQRVQWPDRRQVSQATAVVLGFVAIAGAYLGLADFVAKEIVEFIIG
jgi:preprotein translocase subunit SecE